MDECAAGLAARQRANVLGADLEARRQKLRWSLQVANADDGGQVAGVAELLAQVAIVEAQCQAETAEADARAGEVRRCFSAAGADIRRIVFTKAQLDCDAALTEPGEDGPRFDPATFYSHRSPRYAAIMAEAQRMLQNPCANAKDALDATRRWLPQFTAICDALAAIPANALPQPHHGSR
jgi:hypothetical protein